MRATAFAPYLASLALTPFALAAIAAPACAKEAPRSTQAVGVYISNIAGSGLTYAMENGPSGLGFHVSGIGWGQNGSGFANFGGAVTKSLSEQPWGGLYGLVAVGVGANAGNASASGNSGSALTLATNFAPGLGLKAGFLRAELGYSFYTNSSGSGFTPAGGLGMLFEF